MREPRALTRVLEKLRIKKRTPFVSADQARNAVPVRHPMIKWDVSDEGIVLITIPRRTDLKVRALSILFPMPEKRTIALDEVGSEVWHMCDGTLTVAEMVTRFAKKYKLNRREAEVSLKEFLNTLIKRRYVGLQIDKQTAREVAAKSEQPPPKPAEPPTPTRARRRRRRSRKRPSKAD